MSTWQGKRTEARRAWGAQWREKNREHIRAYMKEYYRKNRDKMRDYQRAYYKENHQRYRERANVSHLKQRYGLTVEEVAALREKQGHRCAICGHERKLVVDHCHGSGVVRGLLCDDCNVGLGRFSDDVEVLRRAIEYLAR